MYAKNISSFLANLVKDGELRIDLEDQITRETLVSRDGQVVHPKVREAFGLEPDVLAPDATPPNASAPDLSAPNTSAPDPQAPDASAPEEVAR
jgi:hypothetical protein